MFICYIFKWCLFQYVTWWLLLYRISYYFSLCYWSWRCSVLCLWLNALDWCLQLVLHLCFLNFLKMWYGMIIQFTYSLQMRFVKFKFLIGIIFCLSIFAACLGSVDNEWWQIVISTHTLRLSSFFTRSKYIISDELIFVD